MTAPPSAPALVVAALFANATIARPAVLTPLSGGAAIACTAVRGNVLRRAAVFGDTAFAADVTAWRLRVADITAAGGAEPVNGDTLTIDGTAYTVIGSPTLEQTGLVWACLTRPTVNV